ncbi:hypothetical protein CDAR_58581 [Caerostris darwini]|uniref:Uncharacterized protein n=1 Tax=Caerostris darwini TaxID=1538125 RepID=A0AAV4U789_9ARAC|nr:hypothetical protein CDAR_58581 [Caerostris darwini]
MNLAWIPQVSMLQRARGAVKTAAMVSKTVAGFQKRKALSAISSKKPTPRGYCSELETGHADKIQKAAGILTFRFHPLSACPGRWPSMLRDLPEIQRDVIPRGLRRPTRQREIVKTWK